MANLRVAYFAHSLRSDWNNGNAHFLRGLLRAVGAMGHDITAFEPERGWSIENLAREPLGASSLENFHRVYPDVRVQTYSDSDSRQSWLARLEDVDIVVLHEWNSPQLAQCLLSSRDELGFRLLFHDTHHRASSSPEQIRSFGVDRFDGVLAFGDALREIYKHRFHLERVWTLHEAADIGIFRPLPGSEKVNDVVWIGNWGDDERSSEIKEFLLEPAVALGPGRAAIYGVRYPEEGLEALRLAGVHYGGYLENLRAPLVYAQSSLTVHIPRQQYSSAMAGIPTIRVFEALACGIPLLSAPWQDTEGLFRTGDFQFVRNGEEMREAMKLFLNEPAAAAAMAARGLETVLARHSCEHRAQEVTAIFKEVLA